uniref:Uncharacterized protein n=1 Tax=Glossina austeni TaxID=7395 RepID=A0A1A9V6Z9_GLOAU
MSAYTSLGELSELSQQDFVKDSSTATFNYSVLSNHYATQLTELATIQHKLEIIQATTIQHPDSSNHNSKIAYSALAISAAAIIILACSMIFLKKAVIAHITAAPTHDNPQHETTPTPAPQYKSKQVWHMSTLSQIYQLTYFNLKLSISLHPTWAIIYNTMYNVSAVLGIHLDEILQKI